MRLAPMPSQLTPKSDRHSIAIPTGTRNTWFSSKLRGHEKSDDLQTLAIVKKSRLQQHAQQIGQGADMKRSILLLTLSDHEEDLA